MYEVEEDTWRVTNLIGTSTFRVDEADLCREDGTPYEGGVLSFLNEFCADSDELYWRRHPEPYPFVNRLTLQDVYKRQLHSSSPFSTWHSLVRARVRRERTEPSRRPVRAAISAVW